MKYNWSDFKNKFMASKNEIYICEKEEMIKDIKKYRTAMEAVVNHVSYITVNKYLRILGTGSSTYESVFGFSNLFKEIYKKEKYIIAHDVFGGLFATERTIQYFAPDSLEWEDLRINYKEFIEWVVGGNINEFYQGFLWDGYEEIVSKVSLDEGIFVYPFFWANECDISTAFKKIVPFKDILDTNYQNMVLINETGTDNR